MPARTFHKSCTNWGMVRNLLGHVTIVLRHKFVGLAEHRVERLVDAARDLVSHRHVTDGNQQKPPERIFDIDCPGQGFG